MIYYSGTYSNLRKDPHPNLGWMLQPRDGICPIPTVRFALDNGCYKGFDEKRWKRKVESVAASDLVPDFVVAPDILAGGRKSADLSYRYRDYLRPLGWPIFLVVQDGMTLRFIRGVFRDWDGIFVGGTTEWKLWMVRVLGDLPSRKHLGRVNSLSRLLYAERNNFESADGSGLARFRTPRHLAIEDYVRGRESAQLRLAI